MSDEDKDIIKMTGNPTNDKGSAFPSTPKSEYIVETFSAYGIEKEDNKNNEE